MRAAASDADLEEVKPDLAAAVAQLAAGLVGGLAVFPPIVPGREAEQARGTMCADLPVPPAPVRMSTAASCKTG
jgi:hypothetical protein